MMGDLCRWEFTLSDGAVDYARIVWATSFEEAKRKANQHSMATGLMILHQPTKYSTVEELKQ